MDNYNLKQFINENKLGAYSKLTENQVDEQSAFVLAADAARDAGKDEFEFPKGSGKMHKVTLKQDIPVKEEAKEENIAEDRADAIRWFGNLKYYYQKAFAELKGEDRETYKQLAKDFFSKLEIDRFVRPIGEGAKEEGEMASTKGKKYSDNPYEKGTKDHLEWSKGHNALRARKMSMSEEANEVDTVTFDVPLLLRMMEYAREDAQTDMDLHRIAENAIGLSSFAGTLGMVDYNSIIGSQEEIAEIRRWQVRAGIIK